MTSTAHVERHEPTTAWRDDWERWHAGRVELVGAPHGLAALSGTHWLAEQARTVDGLPGRWAQRDGRVEGSSAPGLPVLAPGEEARLGRRLLRAIARDGVVGLRILDPDRPVRRTLDGIKTFEPRRDWVLEGHFTPAAPGATVLVDRADGSAGEEPLAGTVRFAVHGEAAAVSAFPAPAGGLQVTFGDTTNGDTTQQFRFLTLPAPDADGRVEVDLNRAYLPPCAFGDGYLCQLPPAENRLAFPVGAGERAPSRRPDVLIDPGTLRDRLDDHEPPTVLDVRWALGDPDGARHHAAGHIPGAVYVDLDTELAAPASDTGGRHPLPALEDLQSAARAWGIQAGRPVVVCDDAGGLAAARAWWLLRWAGLEDVRILDGALAGWTTAGFPLETGPVDPHPGDVTLRGGGLAVIDADEAAALARDGLLLDARAGERYRGEVEPVDPQAGHIPGAVSAPAAGDLDADGRFLEPAELRERFRRLGAAGDHPVGVYCGSGVTAAHVVAALQVAGVDAALFPGSWSAWSADPRRPVAVGDRP